MPLDPVTSIADTLTAGLGLLRDQLNPDQLERIDEAYAAAERDCTDFAASVLAGDRVRVDMALSGLQYGIPARLTPDQYERLGNASLTVSQLTLVGFYCRARGADFAARRSEILTSSVQPK